MFLAILKGFPVELYVLSDQQVKGISRENVLLKEKSLLNMHDAWLYPILSSNILTKFAHETNIINEINLILNAKKLVNTDLYFYGLQKGDGELPFSPKNWV